MITRISETGTLPAMFDNPKYLKKSLPTIIREEFVIVNASPLAKAMVARVTINGAIFKYPIANPLIAPIATDVAITTNMPISPVATVFSPIACITIAPIAPARATVEPTERSILDVRMIIVIPIAARDKAADWRKIFMVVLKVKNLFETKENRI